MVKLMGSEIETDIGSSNGILDGNEDDKFEGASLGGSPRSQIGTNIGSSNDILDGNYDDKFEGESRGDSL